MQSSGASGASTTSPDPAPWLASYPPHVPPRIDPAAIGSLTDLVAESIARYSERVLLESFGTRMTYAEMGQAAGAVASWLQGQGLAKGDRVAIMMPNVMAYVPVLFGVLAAGGVVVNVNPLYTARELEYQLADSGARFLFVLENFATAVEDVAARRAIDTVVTVTPGDLLGPKGWLVNIASRYVKKAVKPFHLPRAIPFRRVMREGRAKPPRKVEITADDIAFLQYTGGTTGIAKGATLSHGNVSANIAQCEAWMGSVFAGREPPMLVTALPLYHIFALTACCMFMVRIGGAMLLIANPRDINGFVATLKARPFTCMSGVNTLYNALAHHPRIGDVDFSRLLLCISGGMATQEIVARRWREITGKPIVEGYGLSETSPVVCVNRPDLDGYSGTIGYPLPSTEVSIRHEETGAPVPFGEPGELCVRGPQVMRGYWKRPDETARVMTPDGFFRTGDMAVMAQDGEVTIIDRIKDMVLVSGFNVYPNEVEDVLASHPGILEAAVIGLPAESSGEQVAAYVVRTDPELSAAEIRAYAREKLTPYKVPRRIEFRDSLPKSNVGKVLRRVLRDEVLGAPPEPDA